MPAQLVSGHSAWTRPETGVSHGQAHPRPFPRTATLSSMSQEQKAQPLSSKAVAVQATALGLENYSTQAGPCQLPESCAQG